LLRVPLIDWGLRDYGVAGQIGLEPTPEEYTEKIVEVFREVRRVLRDDGTIWVNMGDSYAHCTCGGGGAVDIRTDGRNTTPGDKVRGRMAGVNTLSPGLKPKDLVGMPWRIAFALQADGWYLRSDIIWHKVNPMPESVTDRPTKAHEYLFLLSKSAKYFYDADAIKEESIYPDDNRKARACTGQKRFPTNKIAGIRNGSNTYILRNKRTVSTIPTEPYPDAHFATFPTKLVEPCILAGCPEKGTVLDPFAGSGTTLLVADRLDRNAIGIELNPEYVKLAEQRIYHDAPLFSQVETK
jgi:DNA modification methylase